MSRQALQPRNQPSVPAQQAQQDTYSAYGQEQHAEGQHTSSQRQQDSHNGQLAQHGGAADASGQHQQGRIQSVDASKAAHAGRGFRPGGGEGVAAVLASGPPANMFSSPAPQVWAPSGTADS